MKSCDRAIIAIAIVTIHSPGLAQVPVRQPPNPTTFPKQKKGGKKEKVPLELKILGRRVFFSSNFYWNPGTTVETLINLVRNSFLIFTHFGNKKKEGLKPRDVCSIAHWAWVVRGKCRSLLSGAAFYCN